jgi:geranylgeranyl diphosphate synthase type II
MKVSKNFVTYLTEKKLLIDNAINHYFSQYKFPKELCDSMKYSIVDSGKRIRPILTIATAELFDTPVDMVLPFAVAIEAIHTYTLIHDDLPAMDNDDFRRGKPTNHKVFGEAIAILAGDAMLTEAFHIMAEESINKKIPLRKAMLAINEIAFRCGVNGVVGGQVVDILSENKKINFSTLEYIHTHKTGALILASIRVGLHLSKVKKRDFDNLTKYGENIGLAFQIMDDILDVEGEFSKLGKKVGVDTEKKKNTYPSVVGLKESKEILQNLTNTAIKYLEPYGKKAQFLRDFAIYLSIRQH